MDPKLPAEKDKVTEKRRRSDGDFLDGACLGKPKRVKSERDTHERRESEDLIKTMMELRLNRELVDEKCQEKRTEDVEELTIDLQYSPFELEAGRKVVIKASGMDSRYLIAGPGDVPQVKESSEDISRAVFVVKRKGMNFTFLNLATQRYLAVVEGCQPHKLKVVLLTIPVPAEGESDIDISLRPEHEHRGARPASPELSSSRIRNSCQDRRCIFEVTGMEDKERGFMPVEHCKKTVTYQAESGALDVQDGIHNVFEIIPY